ncbi:MAG: hypothetical protein RSA22_09945 [Acinetobacter sp.]
MLKEFTGWLLELEDSLDEFFNIEIVQSADYFTKISLDTDQYISQITFWENHNLYEAEVLDILSGKTIFIQNGECKVGDNFVDLFSDFFDTMNYKLS